MSTKSNEYQTYDEAVKLYKPNDKWLEFEGTPDKFNIAYECSDRYAHLGLAMSLKKSTGDTEHTTFRELARHSNQLANWLSQHGLRVGDHVLFVQDKSISLYANVLGVIKSGGVATYSAPVLGPDSLKHIMRELAPKLVIFDRATRDVVTSVASLSTRVLSEEEIIDATTKESHTFDYKTSVNDVAMIQFSSGTTGLPKPVKLPHKAFVNIAPVMKFATGLKREDTHFHTSATNITIGNLGALSFGAHVCTYSGPFNAERVLEAFEEMKVSSVELPVTAYRKLIRASDLVRHFNISLRTMIYSMEPMDIETFQGIKKVFGKEPFGQYGATEIGPVLANFAAFRDWKIKPLSLGKPYPGQEVAIIADDGTVLPANQTGYIAIKIKDSWRKVGDYGYVDDDGFFFYVSRIDDVIKSSGYRLGPEEIENVINSHGAVNASAVINVPDTQGGQIIRAFIVVKPEVNTSEEKIKEEIQLLVKSRIGKHAYPKQVVIIDSLPQTDDGKIKRKALRTFNLPQSTSAVSDKGN